MNRYYCCHVQAATFGVRPLDSGHVDDVVCDPDPDPDTDFCTDKRHVCSIDNDNCDWSKIQAGVDESGRGSLIGRVYAGAVVLDPSKPLHPQLRDSKKMTRKRRAVVREWIEQNALAWSVAYAEPCEIDSINILKATQQSMIKAIDSLGIQPQLAVIDGDRFCGHPVVPHVTAIKGDDTYAHVAAASVLAKEYHDDHIRQLIKDHPQLDERYDLGKNMGYGTPRHLAGIKKYGITEFHRKTFTHREPTVPRQPLPCTTAENREPNREPTVCTDYATGLQNNSSCLKY